MLDDIEAKLLIVDDLAENLLALEALIRGPGRTIYQARSGEQALALLLEHDFAMAILDVQMPGMNGFELAEMMRSTARTRHIPIVFVSAAGSELNYAFKGYESGAVDFLQKPLDVHAVKSKVNVFVELHRQGNLVRRQLQALERARREQDELLVQLQSARDELQRAVAMRDEFMSVVSQELRSPLHTLFLQAQMRKMHMPSGDSPSFAANGARDMVERDERQIGAMLELIDHMLDVSRLRTGALAIHPKPADLAVLVRRAVRDNAARLDAAGCTVQMDAPDSLPGVWDEFRIEQVVANLLVNAAQYAPGKPVSLQLSAVEGGARLVVRDQGPGVPVAERERMFRQFERGPGSDAVPGLGLGLYLAEQALKAHGGAITLDGEPGQGAVLTIWLPTGSMPAVRK
jgi:signal transduction histidine kinase